MTETNTANTSVELVDLTPRLTALVRRRVAMSDIPQAQRQARALLAEGLKAANVQPVGAPLTMWRMAEPGFMDYAPGVFVAEEFEPSDGITLFTLPQGRAAHLRLNGAYDQLPQAWGNFFGDCKARGLQLAGSNWEVYTKAGDTPAATETDLYALLA